MITQQALDCKQLDQLVDEVLEEILNRLAKLVSQEIWLRLNQTTKQPTCSPVDNTCRKTAPVVLDKKLISESDAAAYYKTNPHSQRVIVAKRALVTPLAVDYFRNRGVRVEYQV